MEEKDISNYSTQDVSNDFILSQKKTYVYPDFFCSDVAVETNLIFSEVVTLIMEHEIQSHFSQSVHREIFSLKYNPRVFFQRMQSLPKK